MPVTETFRNFFAGVVTSMRSDEIPAEASPRAWNNVLVSSGGNHAISAKRRGASVQNLTAITNKPVVHGQVAFKRRSGSTLTPYHLLIDDDGGLNVLDGSTVAAADASNPTPFTAGDHRPATAVANNLCFICNGVDKKKFDGTDVSEFGIERPSAAPTAVDSGVAGNPNGTYEFAISYGNSSTGHESSRSDAVSVTVTNTQITITWTTPLDAQVDQVFLHVRKPTVTTQFFKLTAGCTPAPDGDGAFGVSDDPITVDLTTTQLNALLTLSPDIAENDPPPVGIKALAWHHSRLFAADNSKVYYSKVGLPEAFDPDYFEFISPDDGQNITSIFAAFGDLIVFKSNSMYAIVGTDPQSWDIRQIDPAIGCTSHNSVRFINGTLYWWSERGPVRWSGGGSPELIGESLLAPTVGPTNINYDRLNQVITEIDTVNQKVLFAVPEVNQSRNTILLPFSYKSGGWDSDKWNPFDVASMAVVEDESGQPWVMMGNYGGRVFKWWDEDTDGARPYDPINGTVFTLSGENPTVATTIVTDPSATFDTEGEGLEELYAYFEDAEGIRERRRIVSNTATELTLESSLNITPITYVIATADWQLDTKWSDAGAPFNRKHLIFLWVQGASDTGNGTLTVELFTDWDILTPKRTYEIATSGRGAFWDDGLWDEAVFGANASAQTFRRRLAKVCRHVYRLRVRNQEPKVQIALAKLGASLQPQGTRN